MAKSRQPVLDTGKPAFRVADGVTHAAGRKVQPGSILAIEAEEALYDVAIGRLTRVTPTRKPDAEEPDAAGPEVAEGEGA